MGGTIWEVTRRSFMRLAAASGAGILSSWAGEVRAISRRVHRFGRPESMLPLEREHMPRIQMPRHAEDDAPSSATAGRRAWPSSTPGAESFSS